MVAYYLKQYYNNYQLLQVAFENTNYYEEAYLLKNHRSEDLQFEKIYYIIDKRHLI